MLAVTAEFDWDDVGSWTALPEHLGHDEDSNTLRGEVVGMNRATTLPSATDG